jgi:glycine cleavage system transcriptional repressor
VRISHRNLFDAKLETKQLSELSFMQLAITILGKEQTVFISDILTAVTTHKCNILELSLSDFSNSATAAYLLVEGNWNCLAKLKTALEHLQKRLDIIIHSLHLEAQQDFPEYISYTLEIIAINQDGILQDLITFLASHYIVTKEIKASCYPSYYTQTLLFSTKFVLLIPANIQLLTFREYLLDFCDGSNVDAIFEPIKR